ncbi:MAG: hypothetical protein QGG09_06785 [Pirellulaceae bacterium]|jgi:hypothetical protein|nr:hypothetical protein [Pirellulaceae bacterium]
MSIVKELSGNSPASGLADGIDQMTAGFVTASIAAAASGTDELQIKGKLNISLSGTWSATVTLQRSFDRGTTWLDVQNWTANAEAVDEESEENVLYRIWCKTGDYTSGTAVARLSR